MPVRVSGLRLNDLQANSFLQVQNYGSEHVNGRPGSFAGHAYEAAAKDVVANSPITEKHVGGDGMTLAEICEAAMTVSDNTAGNLILAGLGGPKGITDFARSLGDSMTRLDRFETELNEALPSDPRDTTTPLSMLGNVQKLALGDALSAASKDQLIKWLLANKTGDTRLRAGLPPAWRSRPPCGSSSQRPRCPSSF